MEANYKSTLPANVQRLAEEIEAAAGTEIWVRHDAELKPKAAYATAHASYNGAWDLGITYRAWTPRNAAHELLHLLWRVSGRPLAGYLEGVVLRNADTGELAQQGDNVAEVCLGLHIEHAWIFRELGKLGLPHDMEWERGLVELLPTFHNETTKRIVGIMAGALILMFSPEHRAFAAGRLSEHGLLDDATGLARKLRPRLDDPALAVGLAAEACRFPLDLIGLSYLNPPRVVRLSDELQRRGLIRAA